MPPRTLAPQLGVLWRLSRRWRTPHARGREHGRTAQPVWQGPSSDEVTTSHPRTISAGPVHRYPVPQVFSFSNYCSSPGILTTIFKKSRHLCGMPAQIMKTSLRNKNPALPPRRLPWAWASAHGSTCTSQWILFPTTLLSVTVFSTCLYWALPCTFLRTADAF